MQSLELSCQESDFKLNDALSKIKGHHTASATETTTTLTTRLPTNTQHQNRNQTFNSIQNVQNVQNCSSNESNSTMTTHSTSAATVTSHSRNNNTSTDRLSTSKQSSPSTASSSTHDGGGSGSDGANATITSEKQNPSNTSMPGSTSDSSFFDIHEKLRELYVYLYLKDIQDTQVDNRIKLKSRSFVLETLVARENLNTVILNLYPGNKGYSLAFRQEYLPQNKKYDGLHSIFNRSLTKSQLCGATELNSVNCVRQEKEEHLLETVRWPYENGDLLESVNNEELPILYMKLLLSYAPNAFYSGCVIVEVRDYRQSFPISACCDNYYVLLKPTTQTLLADVKVLSNEEDFTHEDRVALESNMVLATAAPLCLDPSPKVARKAFYSQHKRQMWNTFAIRRQMRKFSQVAINRKRKTDQFTHTQGLDLSDYLFRARQRPRHLLSNSFESSIGSTWKIPRKASDVMKPIRTPNLDLPNTLKPPSSVNVEQLARAYERPRETKDCMPILIEEYILETDRGGGRVYHIKLSIYQRPTNSEYLGELYVDRDYQKNSRNGEACEFSLGTRAHANRYIQQFTEIFTEEGRKSVKITHIVPGHAPKVSYTTGMVESLPLPTQPKGQPPQTQPQQSQQQQQQQQQQQTANPSTSQNPTLATSSQAQLNNQQKVAITLKSPTSAHGVHANPVASDVLGPSQNQPTHLKIANGSVVVVQEQSSGNISRVATITSQQAPNQSSTSTQGIVTNSLPLLAQITNKPATQTIAAASGGPTEINTLTSIIQSPTHSIQSQPGTAQTHKSNNNAAIISLLNSAPAAMTSSAVVNCLNTPSNSPVTIPIQRLIATHTPNNTADNLQQQSQQAQTQTVLLNQDQQANVRVTMSALASQLASPPALMSNSSINPSTFNFAQLKSPQTPSAQPPQQLLINNNNKIRRDSLAAPSPGSDSNASSASSSNLGNFSITPGFPFIGSASPTTSIISNECSSGSIERVPSADKNFLEVSMCGPSPISSGSSSTHFMSPSPKNNVTAIASPLSSPSHPQQTQSDSPSTANSTSTFQIRKQNVITGTSSDSTNPNQTNQPVAQTTTLNLHGINFSSLQGAMATFPGLQNVQVQIPGLAQPISLSLTGATGNTVATASPHQTGLQLESMPVSLGQTTQTVVLTTASQQGQGSVLSLPIAQLVAASNVKNLNPQQLRNVNVNIGPTQANQPQQTHPHIQQQRPRSVPTIAASTINAKQLTARGLITSQRNIAVASNSAQMKITTPITMASVPHATATNLGAVNNNPMLVQLQLQKHHQNQQFHHQNQHQ